jgi:HEAT repeats
MCRKEYLVVFAALVALIPPAALKSQQLPAASNQEQPAARPSAQAPSGAHQPPAGAKQPLTVAIDPNQNLAAAAWALLTSGADSEKARGRSDVLSALTVLNSDRQAVSILSGALADKEENIRVLAATSIGDIKARSAIPWLREALDDSSAQVSFSAAQALWKMGDRSGRDIFYEILERERKPSPTPSRAD